MRDRELVDVSKAATLTGLAPATLYKLARQRRLRSFKVLNALRFSKADLAELVIERPPIAEDAAAKAG
jgi:hypothetical protein